MIISFNTGKIGQKLQQKKITVTENGMDVIIPDSGYDGLSTVYIQTYINPHGSEKDFGSIGYNTEENRLINAAIDSDVAYSKTLYDAWDAENTSAADLYYNDKELVYAPAIDTSNVTNFTNMLRETSIVYTPYYNTSKATTISSMFNACQYLRTSDLSRYDVSNVTDIGGLFANCKNITSVNLSGWDVSNVMSANMLFYNCNNLRSVDLSGWQNKKINNVSQMFNECGFLTDLDLSGFDFSNVGSSTYSHRMFYLCSKLRNLKFGKNFKAKLDVSYTDLNTESFMSVFNGLYDFTGNGETPTAYQGVITIYTQHLANMTDEMKAIPISKGWTIYED